MVTRLWIVLLVLLAGCTTTPPLETPALRLVQAFIPSFEITGRISVRHSGDGFSGNLRWRHALGADEFIVQTPFGQGVARVTQNSQGATLEMADGRVLHAADAQSLTLQALGFRLPLSGMPRWVQALAGSDGAELRYASDGTLQQLHEQGWQIEYESYQTLTQSQGAAVVPNKLSLQNADLKLRLIIDDWQVPAP